MRSAVLTAETILETKMAAQGPPNTGNLEAMATKLETKIENKSLTIGVIGLGYVGLPLVRAFCHKGFKVIGFDVDETKVETLRQGKSYIKHISDSVIFELVSSKLFEPTTNLDRLSEPDALLICVPTPLNLNRDPNLDFVIHSAEEIAARLRKDQIIVLESTTYPGTSEEILVPILEGKSNLKAGLDFAVGYSPEREDPGNLSFETTTIPKIVGANSQIECQIVSNVYRTIIPQIVPVSDLRTAEAVKLTENIFRAVNIALVNELKVIYGTMKIDIWEVIEAAASKPFGFMAFYPGPGLGGHCIPIDPFYLSWKAREYGLSTRFIELSGEVNARMPGFVVDALVSELSTRLGKAIRGAHVLLVGLAYKKNVDDLRESPALAVIELLESRGAIVDYHDPFIPEVPVTRDHAELSGRKSVDLNVKQLTKYDAALIATDHDGVNYLELVSNIPFVIDTRNATHMISGKLREKIVKA